MARPLISCFGLLLLVLGGCSPRYYSPNAHNVPLFTQKGEATISGAYGGGDDVKGAVDVQGAVAVTNNLGLMSNFYRAWGKEPGYGSGSGSMFEAGFGYFHPVTPNFIFSAFAGGGGGNVINYYDEWLAAHSRMNFTRLFLQPAFGFKTRYFSMALSLRAVNLKYHRVTENLPGNNSNGGDDYSYDLAAIRDIRNQPRFFLWEPALTIRGGFENVQFQGQIGISANATNTDFDQEHVNLNLGVIFLLFPKVQSPDIIKD